MRRLRGSMSCASDLPSPSKRLRTSQENMEIQDSAAQRNQRNAEDKAVAQSSDSSDGKAASGTSAPPQTCAAASRRLQKELFDLQNSSLTSIRDIQVDESNLLVWNALIVPTQPPFRSGAFRVELKFPVEYPFKPPRLTLKTKIYHPNFDEKGEICLSIVSPENWKPATRVNQVMEALVRLIHEPEPEHPLRADLAEEFVTNRKTFMKNAEEYTRKFADKRPSRS